MKYRYLFLSLMVLLLACSITAIAAEEASLGDFTFTVPDGFSILNETDEMTALQVDNDHAIVLTHPDTKKDPEDFKTNLESQGYEFGDEDNYTLNQYEIEQYNYLKDDYQGFLYICNFEDDDGKEDFILITYVIPEDEDAPDETNNPVNTILDSLSKAD